MAKMAMPSGSVMLALLVASSYLRSTEAIVAECQPRNGNAFGKCDGCDEQFFMNSQCTQAFVCYSANAEEGFDSCLYECEENEIMLPDFATGAFDCLDNSDGHYICPGRFKIHCEDDPVAMPLSQNNCECEGQLWVSPDCRSGFSCRSRMSTGGFFMECDEGEVIDIDLRTWNWGCQSDMGQCPGGGGFSLGCLDGSIQVPTTCYPTLENPFGICDGCDGQVFLNDDCTQAFQCLYNDDYSQINDGCLYECYENEIMVPDFGAGLFKCVDNSDETYKCPGQFHVRCADSEDALTGTLTDFYCDCEGQLLVTDDCKSGFSCNSEVENGGYSMTCGDEEIIDINIRTWNWGCQPDIGQCPGERGFSLGCESGKVRIPTEGVYAEENPLGTCECEGQTFMDYTCTQAFQCMDDNDHPLAQDGHLYECGENELLIPDFGTGQFKCIDNSDGETLCPGTFQTYCTADPVDLSADSCVCNGQVWVSGDCSEAYACRTMFVDGGIHITCPEGETLHYGAGPIQTYGCAPGTTQCPGGGGYHLGCASGVPPTDGTTESTKTTEDPGTGGGDDDSADTIRALPLVAMACAAFLLKHV